ncbi:helix-turn-helix domain-containing protein [Flavobacterium reichenbachii]|uniref:helix-turn-helix domain-containing protein n=1 Tax=Flavobacterium reichenbachii TaxID=362418 RepID=UPI00068CA908|nr:AraC family transcriptional regulator [Flavobacterium reichenbachii]OXB16940.1 AraC family transcriptional regulator [Flavobacterium reichenbachii]
MEKNKKSQIIDFFDNVKVMGANFSEGHIGDEDFSLINSKVIHPEHTLPYSTPLFYTTFYSIGVVIDAHGSILVDKMPFATKPGMLFINKPGEPQQLTWETMNETYGLCFTENFLSKYAGISIYKTFPFLLFERHVPLQNTVEFQQELKKIILQINTELRRESPLKKKILANLLTRFLLKIKQEFWEGYKINTPQTRNPDIVKDFKQNLEYHYDQLQKGKVNQILYIKDYAEMQHLHENYLSKVLKEKTGKTGSQLIAEKTLGVAKSLIKDSRLSVKEIAYILGFSYISYFNIFFKKHTGQTPGSYRKKSLY